MDITMLNLMRKSMTLLFNQDLKQFTETIAFLKFILNYTSNFTTNMFTRIFELAFCAVS